MSNEDLKELKHILTSEYVDRKGLFLFSIENTIRILEIAQRQDIWISGVDAIILHEDGKTQPDMANDFDFLVTSIPDAISTMKKLDGRYHFELLDNLYIALGIDGDPDLFPGEKRVFSSDLALAGGIFLKTFK